LSSGELANLTNREADVAIRVVYDRKTCRSIFTAEGTELFGASTCSGSTNRVAADAPDPIRWIVISIDGIPTGPARFRTTGVRSGSRTGERRSLQYGRDRDDDTGRASSEMPTPYW